MRLNYKRTFFVGLAFLSISSFWQLYDNIIPLILKNTFGMGEVPTGVIMAMDNVLAVFLLPFFGALSDRTDTKLGKRTPFILFGTIAAVVSMSILPVADNQQNKILFLTVLGIVLIAMGSYRSPAVALMPDLTPKPLRSKANAVINLMGAIGGAYTLVMVKLFVGDGDQPNYLPVFITVSAIMIFAVLMLLITIREKKLNRIKAEDLAEKKNGKVSSISNESSLNDSNEDTLDKEPEETGMPKEVRKSFIFILLSIVLWFMAYNAVTTAFSRYSMEVWDREVSGFADSLLIALVAASISFIPIGILSSKFGRKKMIIAGIIIMTCSYMCGVFIKEYSVLVNVIFAFTGIGWAAINVNSYPMVVEMSKGSNIGKYTGYYYTFSMLAQIITPILSGALLEISYRTLFPYAVFFSFASLCTMMFVKHGDSIPAKRKDLLENYDVND